MASGSSTKPTAQTQSTVQQLRQLSTFQNSARPLLEICQSVAADWFKTIRNRCLRQEDQGRSDQEKHIALANAIVALFQILARIEHDLFRGGESLQLYLLEWIARTETES